MEFTKSCTTSEPSVIRLYQTYRIISGALTTVDAVDLCQNIQSLLFVSFHEDEPWALGEERQESGTGEAGECSGRH